VIDREYAQLIAAGHEVRQYFAAPGDADEPAWRQATSVIWNPRTRRDVETLVREFRPDVVHVHTPFPMLSPSVFWAAHAAGAPTVATVHSYRYSCVAGTLRRDDAICEDCVGSRMKLAGVRHRCYHDSTLASGALTVSLGLHRALGTFNTKVDRFLTMTEFSRALLARDGVPASHITVKPNCTDDPGAPLEYDHREPVVLFVGRLVPEKGITTLVDAWRHVVAPGYRLVVLGDGPLRAEVERVAAQDPTIEVRGWQPEEAVHEAQRRAAVTVVPSEWYEAGPPLVHLQALASGTPVVVCDLENVSSTTLAAGAGIDFRTGDARSLAAALTGLLADPTLAAGMSRAARELYLRDHTPAATLQILESTYRAVCDSQRVKA
jgi:glycosyltransferase involved in cell wall biosynthesis